MCDIFTLSFSPQATQAIISNSTVKERVIVFISGAHSSGTEPDGERSVSAKPTEKSVQFTSIYDNCVGVCAVFL